MIFLFSVQDIYWIKENKPVSYWAHDAANDRMTSDTLSIALPGHELGAVSIRKTVLPGMAIPMLKIRRPNGRLIFNMEITIRR